MTPRTGQKFGRLPQGTPHKRHFETKSRLGGLGRQNTADLGRRPRRVTLLAGRSQPRLAGGYRGVCDFSVYVRKGPAGGVGPRCSGSWSGFRVAGIWTIQARSPGNAASVAYERQGFRWWGGGRIASSRTVAGHGLLDVAEPLFRRESQRIAVCLPTAVSVSIHRLLSELTEAADSAAFWRARHIIWTSKNKREDRDRKAGTRSLEYRSRSRLSARVDMTSTGGVTLDDCHSLAADRNLSGWGRWAADTTSSRLRGSTGSFQR